MVAQDANGTPLWRCSGALISQNVFLTAGHCTEAPAAHVEIWFDSDVQVNPNYPYTGDVGGTPYTHPSFDPGAFYLYDLGVVVLDSPVSKPMYGALPQLGILDELATKRGQQKTTIKAVGYGLQKSSPVGVEAYKIRLQADLRLIDVNGTAGIPAGTSVMLSNNANTGGTCFGDSGGPLFLDGTNVIVAVTSFGLNGNCAGTGGGYRVDTADDLAWLANYGF
ncbi:MAG: S1 family peptidase [Anaerolineae bacterium]|nr:S1 family peptidase [Anaerolineae bacterium]